jgi:hypothetical protein
MTRRHYIHTHTHIHSLIELFVRGAYVKVRCNVMLPESPP